MNQEEIRVLILPEKFAISKKMGIRVSVIPVVNSGINGFGRLKLYSFTVNAKWNVVIKFSEPVISGGCGFSTLFLTEGKNIVTVQGPQGIIGRNPMGKDRSSCKKRCIHRSGRKFSFYFIFGTFFVINQMFQISEISCAGFILAGIQKYKNCFFHRGLL